MLNNTNFKTSWALYDGCNSIVHLIIITIFLPWFYDSSITTENSSALEKWSSLVFVSLLTVGVFAIFSAKLIDRPKMRYFMFIFSNIVVAICSFSIALSLVKYIEALPFIALSLLVLFNISLYLYDSYIIDASGNSEFMERVSLSGKGWSVGYIFSGLFLFVIWWISDPSSIGTTNSVANIISWSAVLFSITAVLILALWTQPDSVKTEKSKQATFLNILWPRSSQDKKISLFLIFAFFLQDGAVTLTYIVTLISKQALSFSLYQTIELFLIVHAVGIVSTWVLGDIALKVGIRRLYTAIILLWLASVALAFFLISGNITINAVYILSAIIGLLIGSTPSLLRATYSQIVPYDNRASYFGFGAVFQRTFSFIGPLLVLISAKITGGSYEIATLIIGALFLVSAILFFANKQIIDVTNATREVEHESK